MAISHCITMGAMVAAALYDRQVSVLELPAPDYSRLCSAQALAIDLDGSMTLLRSPDG